MTTEKIHNNKIMPGLSVYIMELDALRPPLLWGVINLSFGNVFELFIKSPSKSYLIKNNRDLQKRVLQQMRPYRTDTQLDPKEMMKITLYLFGLLFVILAFTVLMTIIYSLSLLNGAILLIIIALPTLHMFFAYAVTWRRGVLGTKYDENV